MSNDFSEKKAEPGNFIKCKDCSDNLKYLKASFIMPF